MQTPPDSEGPVDDDENISDDAAQFGNRQITGRLARSVSGRPSTSIRAKTVSRRQKPVKRSIKTPESFIDEPLVLHKPSSAATRLRLELISMMDRTQRHGTWMTLVPSRIGHSEAIDSAAKAIVKAVEHSNVNTSITEDSCLGSYSKALTTLRDDMQKPTPNDDLLLTVALLVTFERVFAYSSIPLRSHMHGVVAIMMQAKSGKPPSEMTRALQYQFWAVAFIGPCVMGVPSPFEAPRWLDADPVLLAEDELTAPWKVVSRLRKMSNQLFIRLPRLIMLVKGLQVDPDREKVTEAIILAKDLLEIEDIDAESAILHHVRVSLSISYRRIISHRGIDSEEQRVGHHTILHELQVDPGV